ncbi:class I SAM-dependent methyltransferase [Deinococcus sp. MIMF12]|uniref:Class I SAM-dependent methyltransferase n=1 Tax=Deinococcus rhizophilus TaxID=3049544 RepID=A0ABT7JEN5_9DEIO|nr:class I SAM-dependent methyltransferase [Deinococcus rhizophilus]MDL2343524.1 class I SAM-dependent methyltransferase [Deinococcus rhizophilus]
MSDRPHSREWYARLARELGGYRHGWTRELDGPDPELTFDVLLAEQLGPGVRVLEAGCGHGPDAARFGGEVGRWVAYDSGPELLEQARANAPHADFHLWNGKGTVPDPLRGPFDLIVSRRGPTGVILRLPELAAPGAHFLYVGPRLDVPQVPERLHAVDWDILGEWRVSVQAWAPTWEAWVTRCEWMGEEARLEDWQERATPRGLSYREERYVVLAGAP